MKIRIAFLSDTGGLMGLYHKLSDNYQDNPDAIVKALTHVATTVFVAEVDGRLVGTATVSFRAVPSYGLVAYVDDVVVDPDCRGQGLGKKLTHHCIADATARGCRRIELTSHPLRIEANVLYQRLGFALRETNSYVLKIKP